MLLLFAAPIKLNLIRVLSFKFIKLSNFFGTRKAESQDKVKMLLLFAA
jgi:hypothetical protein